MPKIKLLHIMIETALNPKSHGDSMIHKPIASCIQLLSTTKFYNSPHSQSKLFSGKILIDHRFNAVKRYGAFHFFTIHESGRG